MIARTTSFIKNCLIGMTVLVALLAAGRFWIATVFGLLASFFWYPGVIFSRPAAVMLGIMGYLAIPAPFIPLIIRHPYWAGIPVCVLMLVWHAVCRVWGKKLGVAMQKDRVVLEGLAWAGLLRKWPRLEEWCDWSTLDGWSWAHLLAGQPQFADKCDWTKLDDENWGQLLEEQPQFADKRGK